MERVLNEQGRYCMLITATTREWDEDIHSIITVKMSN